MDQDVEGQIRFTGQIIAVKDGSHLRGKPSLRHSADQVIGARGFELLSHQRQQNTSGGRHEIDQVGWQVERQRPRRLPRAIDDDKQLFFGQFPVVGLDNLLVQRNRFIDIEGASGLRNPLAFIVLFLERVQFVECLIEAGQTGRAAHGAPPESVVTAVYQELAGFHHLFVVHPDIKMSPDAIDMGD